MNVDLQGQWQFALDTANVGEKQKWYLSDLDDIIQLPGTTDFHTNWQWFSIIKASNSLILDNTSNDYFPIVQVIDNLERNHKLGLVFEFKVGKGKLIVLHVATKQFNRQARSCTVIPINPKLYEFRTFQPWLFINSRRIRSIVITKQ